MKIQRIDGYSDSRFREDVLKQHGAFLIDDAYPCQIFIRDKDSAVIDYHDGSDIKEIIDEFRFYAKHITKFYAKDGRLLKSHDDIELLKIGVDQLQPSQFYVNAEKLNAIAGWAKNTEHFIIPILKHADGWIILDGHTRLYLAKMLNMEVVYAYEDSSDEYIHDFVAEARRRKIHAIQDLILVSSADYELLWHKFCDDYFNRQAEAQEECSGEHESAMS